MTLGSNYPPIQWALTSTVKGPEREADHSAPPGVEICNVWSIISTSPTDRRDVVITHRGIFNLLQLPIIRGFVCTAVITVFSSCFVFHPEYWKYSHANTRNKISVQLITNIIKLTPWSRVLLEKLTVTQLVEKFSAFYGTCRFIILFTRAHNWPLSYNSM
jgi:hypothetical protein